MKKIISVLLALVMCMSLCAVAWAEDEWTGSGTEADPYVITTEVGLKKLADDVNGGTTYSGTFFKLGGSITVAEWTPIGQKGSENKFAGTFDGNNNTITINGISGSLDTAFGNYAALFGATSGATIRNLTIAGSINGVNVAGVVGQMNGGTVENCTNNANITGSEKAAGIAIITKSSASAVIRNCKNFGEIRSTNNRAGGIMNLIEADTQVLNCTNSGTVTAEGTANYGAGGIVGWAAYDNFIIDQCTNTAAVTGKGAAGGVLGGTSNAGEVSNCINNGAVTLSGTAGTSDEHANMGGIVGQGSSAQEKLTATKNSNTGMLNGDCKRRTIAEDVTLAEQSYPQLYISKGANVEITAGKLENYTENYGTLTVKTQVGESGAQGINTQFHNHGKAILNCTMKAGSIHSYQGAETIFDGGDYHFTCIDSMRNGLRFVSGTFRDLRAGNGEVQWTNDEFEDYVADGATFTHDEANHVWTVTMPVSGVTLDKNSAEIKVGETLTLTAVVAPETATDKTVAWTSSNTAVATVDANGVVTALAEGEATITATAGNATATCVVTVKAASVPDPDPTPVEPERPAHSNRRYPAATTTTETPAKGGEVTSAKTFDGGVMLYAGMALTSALGMAWMGKKRGQ